MSETNELKTIVRRAVQLANGDVIRDPEGGLHKVTDWESFPLMAICFNTDTGQSINKSWDDQSTYDVLYPRPDGQALAELRAAGQRAAG